MTEHYYSRQPKVESNPKMLNTTLRGETFTFKTDQGVFSKGDIDFGSRLLIETFVIPEVEGAIVDVGCGYGPIGLSLAKSFPDRKIHMIDINERAIELTKANVQYNDVRNVEVYASDRLSGLREKNVAAIVTNPPIRAGKKVVHAIFEESHQHLASGGHLYVVIQKKQGAPSAKKKLEDLFDTVEVVTKQKGYYILKAIKH